MPTPEHPPPAPDWVMGEDGHWKPPPFTSGPSRPAAPPPPPAGPVTGPMPGPQGWSASPGQPGWPGGPPPPAPAERSPAATAAIVVGSVVGIGFLGIAVLLGAVTFLGTKAETRFEPVGVAAGSGGGLTQIPTDDDPSLDRPAPTDASPPALTLSEQAALLSADALAPNGADWVVTGVEDVAPTAGLGSGACMPEGWLTGATDRFRAYIGRPATGNPRALTLSFTTYESDGAALDELGRVGGEPYRACEVEERLGEVTGPATDATVVALAPDPAAPGVIYQIDLVGGDPLTEYEFTVFVGRMRAHVDFCGCADLTLDEQTAVARQVAASLAEVQGLPAPG